MSMVYAVAETPFLHIDAIGINGGPDNAQFGPGLRGDYYCIHYVVNGRGFYNGHPVRAGQGFLITPNSYQHYYPDPQDPWDYVWFDSGDPNMDGVLALYTTDPQTGLFSYESVGVARALMPWVTENANRVVDSPVLLEKFLHLLNSHIAIHTPPGAPNREVYLQYACKYILANLHLPVTVEDITRFVGIGQPYLYRIFKERTGLSPKQYILAVKLDKAKSLLTETTLSVAEIANSVGYADQLQFSKFFSRSVGVSPRDFRHSQQSI